MLTTRSRTPRIELICHYFTKQGGDDTAANFVGFMCRDFASLLSPSVLVLPPNHGTFGYWGHWSGRCGFNSAICGLRTKVEGNLGGRDDTALNNVEFYCCEENPEIGK